MAADIDTPIPFMLPPLSTGQLRMLNAICRHWRDRQIGPTIRELQDATGLASPNAVAGYLAVLARKGYIEHDRKMARGIWPAGLRATVRSILTTEPVETT